MGGPHGRNLGSRTANRETGGAEEITAKVELEKSQIANREAEGVREIVKVEPRTAKPKELERLGSVNWAEN
jgi:hypothetical protein